VYKISERTVVGRIMEIINEIIKKEKLPFYRADIELVDLRRKQPDIVIYKALEDPFCVIEVKPPFILLCRLNFLNKLTAMQLIVASLILQRAI